MSERQNHPLHGRAWEELNRDWNRNDCRSSSPISAWPQAVCYGISFFLTTGWTSLNVWNGYCGTPAVNQGLACLVFSFVAILAFVWAGFARRDWSASVRFFISGAVPIVFPYVIVLLGR